MWGINRGHHFQYTPYRSVVPPRSVAQSTQSTYQTNQTNTSADNCTFVDVNGTPANGNPVAGISQNGKIVSHGIVEAYVCDMEPVARLSGIYDKTINGVAAGKVVISVDESGTFVMSQTKSSQLESLQARLDSLTLS